MTPNEIVPLLSVALRNVLRDTHDTIDPATTPDDVFEDLAFRLVLRLIKSGLTVSPTRPEELFKHAQGEAARRIFSILTVWLAEHPKDRALITNSSPSGKFYASLTDSNTTCGFFTGVSVQDALAQAAQTVSLEEKTEAAQ